MRKILLPVALAASMAGCAPQSAQTQAASPPAEIPAGPLPLKYKGGPTSAAITPADMMTRLYLYADDSLQGRRFGTEGNLKATAYIAAEFQRLGLQPAGDSGTYFQYLDIQRIGRGRLGPSRNVVAIIPGSDPVLRHEYVAIGAHNDHIGVDRPIDHDSARAFSQELARAIAKAAAEGTTGSAPVRPTIKVNVDSLRALRPARADSINNGADDDGSGTVALIELAEAIQAMPVKPKRSILFVSHTGEESGLWGSRYYTDNPTVPRDSIIAQINLDMIGRGNAEDVPGKGGPRHINVVGSRRLSTELGDIVEEVNKAQPQPFELDYTYDANGHPMNIYCRSDHAMYARFGIPVVFFFTGLHADYHRVTDEPQYIDYDKLTRTAKMVEDLAIRLGNRPTRPVVDKPKPDPKAGCRQ